MDRRLDRLGSLVNPITESLGHAAEMILPRETWTAILRPDEDGIIRAHGMLTLRELFEHASDIELRMRFNPDMHLFTWHPPNGVTRERLFEAFDLLTDAERHRLYCLPNHRLVSPTGS